LYIGSEYSFSFQWVENGLPIDLTGWYALMGVKKYVTSTESILSLSSDNGDIILDVDGNITIKVEASVTALLSKMNCVYDIVLTDPLMKVFPPLVGGRFYIIPMIATT
jgi:hypothetical protein